jgi:hypothetical protein
MVASRSRPVPLSCSTTLPQQVHLRKGEGLLFDAKLFHAGMPITRGTRYLLVRTTVLIPDQPRAALYAL